MKMVKTVVAFFLILNVLAFTLAVPRERLWISFTGPRSGKYLMQIDALGNIVLPPIRILESPKTPPGYVTALSLNGSKALNLWFISARSPFAISRIVVDKRTLRAIRFVKTNLRSVHYFSSLTVTHRTDDNLISFPAQTRDGVRIIVYPLDKFGHVERPGWFLSPLLLPPGCQNCQGGIPGSGRLGFWVSSNSRNGQNGLHMQPLGPRAQPNAETVRIAKISGSTIVATFPAADITNRLPGDKKLVAYIKHFEEGEQPETVIVRAVDAKTGGKIGSRIVLKRQSSIGGNIKIDPLGRFVLFFTEPDFETPNALTYQALDATGHRSGSPKILATNTSAQGMDLLREKL
jgi:hypothetical protein